MHVIYDNHRIFDHFPIFIFYFCLRVIWMTSSGIFLYHLTRDTDIQYFSFMIKFWIKYFFLDYVARNNSSKTSSSPVPITFLVFVIVYWLAKLKISKQNISAIGLSYKPNTKKQYWKTYRSSRSFATTHNETAKNCPKYKRSVQTMNFRSSKVFILKHVQDSKFQLSVIICFHTATFGDFCVNTLSFFADNCQFAQFKTIGGTLKKSIYFYFKQKFLLRSIC